MQLFKTNRSEKGQCSAEAAIIILILAFIGLMIWASIQNSNKIKAFDADFAAGKIEISAAAIALSESGHPQVTSQLGYIPSYGDYVSGSPRSLSVSNGCVSLRLASNTARVKVATTFPDSSLVNVQMPPQASGTVNVCVPNQSAMVIYIWAEATE